MTVERRDALVQRLFETSIGAMELGAVYLGVRLGLYEALVRLGGGTAGELAAATGTHERYVREWLEQQAVAGVCGGGWSSIGIARAYPGVRVDGFDLDEHSIALATEHVRRRGSPTA